ncbi:erythromycin esterase family protein [Clostridium acetireducens]|uniref:erythromycin esterase family protein n=1 Tax=Clostridium acetireducens TaxID=76489 RepID=UPI0008729B61|nr:erythromycin esterase family protein [Clostridium acetireducens]
MSEGILQAGFHIIYSNDINVDAATKGITSMGEHLKNAFKDEYYSIGTDCYETEFLAYDSKSDSRREFEVKNKSQNSIAFLLNDLKVKDAWIDLHKVKENKELNEVLSKKQRMITIGDKFTSWYSCSNKFYTLNMEPCNAYDAIIFIDSVKPVNILK